MLFPKKAKVIQYRRQWKQKIDYYAFKLNKSNKTCKRYCETTTNQSQYPTNTTVIAGNVVTNGIRDERSSGKNGIVKVRNFADATRENIRHNLIPTLERKPCHLILHVRINNAKSCPSKEVLGKLLTLNFFISKKCPQYQTILSIPKVRSDKAKANLKVRHLVSHFL